MIRFTWLAWPLLFQLDCSVNIWLVWLCRGREDNQEKVREGNNSYRRHQHQCQVQSLLLSSNLYSCQYVRLSELLPNTLFFILFQPLREKAWLVLFACDWQEVLKIHTNKNLSSHFQEMSSALSLESDKVHGHCYLFMNFYSLAPAPIKSCISCAHNSSSLDWLVQNCHGRSWPHRKEGMANFMRDFELCIKNRP